MANETDLIQRALDVQDACNLSGVVHAFSRDISELWKVARQLGHGTDWVNQHRVSKLYADKIKSLAGEPSILDFDSP